ncbi:hypothetical protein PR048_004658 [Dryococelus australis]|uniref:CCHC-type domain-containing protein n=1 Tax=Dryococelus australis TaxID=614101 RepID=A0ABQ9I616_9NEOP|nr:hypothetical protein PR048_004658 [Dryococelus australis]
MLVVKLLCKTVKDETTKHVIHEEVFRRFDTKRVKKQRIGHIDSGPTRLDKRFTADSDITLFGLKATFASLAQGQRFVMTNPVRWASLRVNALNMWSLPCRPISDTLESPVVFATSVLYEINLHWYRVPQDAVNVCVHDYTINVGEPRSIPDADTEHATDEYAATCRSWLEMRQYGQLVIHPHQTDEVGSEEKVMVVANTAIANEAQQSYSVSTPQPLVEAGNWEGDTLVRVPAPGRGRCRPKWLDRRGKCVLPCGCTEGTCIKHTAVPARTTSNGVLHTGLSLGAAIRRPVPETRPPCPNAKPHPITRRITAGAEAGHHEAVTPVSGDVLRGGSGCHRNRLFLDTITDSDVRRAVRLASSHRMQDTLVRALEVESAKQEPMFWHAVQVATLWNNDEGDSMLDVLTKLETTIKDIAARVCAMKPSFCPPTRWECWECGQTGHLRIQCSQRSCRTRQPDVITTESLLRRLEIALEELLNSVDDTTSVPRQRRRRECWNYEKEGHGTKKGRYMAVRRTGVQESDRIISHPTVNAGEETREIQFTDEAVDMHLREKENRQRIGDKDIPVSTGIKENARCDPRVADDAFKELLLEWLYERKHLRYNTSQCQVASFRKVWSGSVGGDGEIARRLRTRCPRTVKNFCIFTECFTEMYSVYTERRSVMTKNGVKSVNTNYGKSPYSRWLRVIETNGILHAAFFATVSIDSSRRDQSIACAVVMVKLYAFNVKQLRKLNKISAYTRQKAKPKNRDRIRLERASQKQSSDTHEAPYDREQRSITWPQAAGAGQSNSQLQQQQQHRQPEGRGERRGRGEIVIGFSRQHINDPHKCGGAICRTHRLYHTSQLYYAPTRASAAATQEQLARPRNLTAEHPARRLPRVFWFDFIFNPRLMKYDEIGRSAQQASWDVHLGRRHMEERRPPQLYIAPISAWHSATRPDSLAVRGDSSLPRFGNASPDCGNSVKKGSAFTLYAAANGKTTLAQVYTVRSAYYRLFTSSAQPTRSAGPVGGSLAPVLREAACRRLVAVSGEVSFVAAAVAGDLGAPRGFLRSRGRDPAMIALVVADARDEESRENTGSRKVDGRVGRRRRGKSNRTAGIAAVRLKRLFSEFAAAGTVVARVREGPRSRMHASPQVKLLAALRSWESAAACVDQQQEVSSSGLLVSPSFLNSHPNILLYVGLRCFTSDRPKHDQFSTTSFNCHFWVNAFFAGCSCAHVSNGDCLVYSITILIDLVILGTKDWLHTGAAVNEQIDSYDSKIRRATESTYALNRKHIYFGSLNVVLLLFTVQLIDVPTVQRFLRSRRVKDCLSSSENGAALEYEGGGNGRPRGNPPTSGIVPPTKTRFALVGGEQSNRSVTATPCTVLDSTILFTLEPQVFCSLAAAPESCHCYSTHHSKALATCSLASLLFAQSRLGRQTELQGIMRLTNFSHWPKICLARVGELLSKFSGGVANRFKGDRADT